ncbi:hypothetical protein PGT21_029054 [Puccinia graminis f. sp. tritici]|uniref:Uncharacterized protein n=1 Tax=Puccinia graminis f. sp. tritici TaxID=56615 RepID=A0A5B0QBJ2_PUCGR|nr:hypothetical protein PGT21_029054 [Puccinia graminis f. sp. tritici]
MDPPYGAYNRIRLFLADLNLVLGCLPAPTPYRPVALNSFVSPQNPHRSSLDFHSHLSGKQPTHRSQAWKNTHSRLGRKQTRKAGTASKSYPVDFPSIQRSAHVYSRHKHQGPQESSQRSCQSFSTNRHQPSKSCRKHNVQYVEPPYKQDPQSVEDLQGEPYTTECLDQEEPSATDYPNDSAEDHSSLKFQPPCGEMFEDEQINFRSDKSIGDTHELDENKWVDRSDLDINADPDYLEQQPEPAFDLKNYSAEDVDNWASTLSAEEFEHLRIMGPNARTESFRQYAISNLDRPTQTLSSSTHEHLDQPVLPSIGDKDNSDYHHHQPDDIGSNNFDQQQLATPDDESRSMFYNHSDDCNSHLEAFDDNGFDEGFVDGSFDDGRVDDGGFDDGGFDDGSFDDGGFDDGGFDDGGFDDGGFDDGGFDGGLDDGYGSPYY